MLPKEPAINNLDQTKSFDDGDENELADKIVVSFADSVDMAG